MDIFKEHDIFEIEVLSRMKSARLLDPLVFGGGTMMRLCHDLNRYSADLDFWFIKRTPPQVFFQKASQAFARDYEITGAQVKHYTLLFELRSAAYPKRLKVEIRKQKQDCDFQEKIAFSRFSNRQVALRAHTLAQTMRNKVAAFLDRWEIRDCFDIEFLLRRGIGLPPLSSTDVARFHKILFTFKDNDFKVKLGSILESQSRNFYTADKFSYLKEKLSLLTPSQLGV